MSESDSDDRTEQPSEKRLREAREKGDVPRSRELANVAVLGSATLALMAVGPHLAAATQGWMRNALTLDRSLLDEPQRLPIYAAKLFGSLALPMLPLVGAAIAGCFIAPAIMSGVRFSNKALTPDFKRMSPLAGMKRMYGKESVAELLRSLLRLGLLAGIASVILGGAFSKLIALSHGSLEDAASWGTNMALGAFLAMVGGLALLAAVDVPWQRWSWHSKLKMTKQEVRDEHKEQEGNPEIKARVRQVARQMSQQRMMEAVPTADVIVMNPTHYAVALKYDAGKMRAPRVVAKGVDEIALRIRDLAQQNRVSVVEAPPLARALYRQGEIDQEIPVKLYAAVAQVLSFVYQLRRWHPAHGPMPQLNVLDVGADGVVNVEPSPTPPDRATP